jgi:NTP pyrophosphatase (non-canonical NTP hydrolase)
MGMKNNLNYLMKESEETWRFPKEKDRDLELLYCALALCGEAGELANLIKKNYRLKYLTEGHADRKALDKAGDELVDVLYYSFRLASILGIDLDHAWNEKMETNRQRFLLGSSQGDEER